MSMFMIIDWKVSEIQSKLVLNQTIANMEQFPTIPKNVQQNKSYTMTPKLIPDKF